MGESEFDPRCLTVVNPRWKGIPWLVHGISTRHLAPPDADRSKAIVALQVQLDLPTFPCITGEQVHEKYVQWIDDPASVRVGVGNVCEYAGVDALLTPMKKFCLAIFTADCVPIFIVETRRKIVGLVHAGWRGTLERILKEALETLMRVGGALESTEIWIGPAISQARYEVTPELADDFARTFPDAGDRIKGRRLDLVGINVLQASEMGVPPSQIHVAGLCTRTMVDTFYSYRADGKEAGRLVSMIARLD